MAFFILTILLLARLWAVVGGLNGGGSPHPHHWELRGVKHLSSWPPLPTSAPHRDRLAAAYREADRWFDAEEAEKEYRAVRERARKTKNKARDAYPYTIGGQHPKLLMRDAPSVYPGVRPYPFRLPHDLSPAVKNQSELINSMGPDKLPGQLNPKGYAYILGLMLEIGEPNMLLFGLGLDTRNYLLGSPKRLMILEDILEWIKKVDHRSERITVSQIKLGTKVANIDRDLRKIERMTLQELEQWSKISGTRPDLDTTDWDIIFVDGPMGFRGRNPGRLRAIACAVVQARRILRKGSLKAVHILVHDFNRVVEAAGAIGLIGLANLVRVATPSKSGVLAHFVLTADSPRPPIPPRAEWP